MFIVLVTVIAPSSWLLNHMIQNVSHNNNNICMYLYLGYIIIIMIVVGEWEGCFNVNIHKKKLHIIFFFKYVYSTCTPHQNVFGFGYTIINNVLLYIIGVTICGSLHYSDILTFIRLNIHTCLCIYEMLYRLGVHAVLITI